MQKVDTRLVLFVVFGLALWFFGNLYEAVVIAPNLVVDTATKITYWRGFFSLTNPVYFYIPVAPQAALTTFFCLHQGAEFHPLIYLAHF